MPKVETLLSEALYEVNTECNEILFKCMSKAMRKAKKDVIAMSPEGDSDRHYKNGWAIRTKRLKYGFDGVIYNKDKPGLTHLLNNGHVIANQYGSTGRRKNGDNHITKAHDVAEAYLLELLQEAQL